MLYTSTRSSSTSVLLKTLIPITSEFSLISALRSASPSPRAAPPLHALAIKSGHDRSPNPFVHNALLNLYSKSGQFHDLRRLFASSPCLDAASWNIALAAGVKSGCLDYARQLFNEIPHKDCVSFTTLIMGLAQGGFAAEALLVFSDMVAAGLMPNEVTLASVLSACSRLGSAGWNARIVHGVAVKCGLDVFVLVGTNLVHVYAVGSELGDSRAVFELMPEKNTVSWNVLLNAYAKAGLVGLAEDLFERIPLKDVVSWSTMIDGYLRSNRLGEAMKMFKEMHRSSDAKLNQVLLVDLMSVCARSCDIQTGQQLHALVIKTGLDRHTFVQATLIHLYGACGFLDLACLQFETGCQSHVPSWNAMLAGLIKNNKVETAAELFRKMPDKDVVSWSTMIAGYEQNGAPNLALDLFHEMQSVGCEPNEITLVSVLSAVSVSGTLEQGKWIHEYITHKTMPLTVNLSAGLIDMYAKLGEINSALQVFDNVKKLTSVSPWNAIICGLAMHGQADMSLSIFSDMQAANVRPNSITFIGVLGACCHNGLVALGRQYFDIMRNKYRIEPTIKHYGCMVDLLARAGCLEEAEQLINSMPMEADVKIWGSMLAAARTYGNVDIGERAERSLGRLEPSHGAAKVLLSNIYADADRWRDVVRLRGKMERGGLKKLPGSSSINSSINYSIQSV